jgi:DNA-directed RNA polymerase
MDIEVNKNQIERVVIKWLNIYYGDLTTKTYLNIPDRVLYVDKRSRTVLEYDEDNEYGSTVWVDSDILWSKITEIFHLKYNDIQSILQVWLKETYNLEGVTASQTRLALNFGFD